MFVFFFDDGLRGNKNVIDRYDDINGIRCRDVIFYELGILVGINYYIKFINVKIFKFIWLKCFRVRYFKMVWVKEERFVLYNDLYKVVVLL